MKSQWGRFLAALFILCIGIWAGLGLSERQSSQGELSQNTFLSEQLNLLSQDFHSKITEIQYRAIQLSHLTETPDPAPLKSYLGKSLMYWSEWELDAQTQQPLRVYRAYRNPSWKVYSDPFHDPNEELNASLKESFQALSWTSFWPSLLKEKRAFFFLKTRSMQRQDLIGMVFIPQKSSAPRNLFVVLVDSTQILGLVQKLSQQRAYFITSEGKVLSHTKPSYRFSSYQSSDIFKLGIKKLFSDKSGTDTSGKFTSVDGLPVFARFRRLDPFPLVVGIEAIQSQNLSAPEDLNFSYFPIMQKIVFWIGLICAGFWGFQIGKQLYERRKRKVLPPDLAELPSLLARKPPTQTSFRPLKSKFTDPNFVIELPSWLRKTENRPASSIANAHSGAQAAGPPLTISSELSPHDIRNVVENYEFHASQVADSRLLFPMLAQTASHLCESSTVFFRFDPASRKCQLETDAGFDSGQAPSQMSFVMEVAAVEKILDCARRQRLASLAQYQPLSQVILKSLGIAVFEAWAVTTSIPRQTALNRPPSEPKLLGVLVILQSGVPSATRRDFLARILRTTGFVVASKSPS